MSSQAFNNQYPGKFYLTEDLQDLISYLSKINFLHPNERLLSVEKPGEGNMNKVLRLQTNERTCIIKQARPWVEKYPTIEAPVERNSIEARYYSAISENITLQQYSPQLKHHDPENFIMMLSDLGSGADFLWMYDREKRLDGASIVALAKYLNELHQIPIQDFPLNMKMRKLNHEHIFHFPFVIDNGFNLDDVQLGLEQLKQKYAENRELVQNITRLGNQYLESGSILVQGDFYPGSWIDTTDGLKVIDPEFCFPGFQEFDLGVFIAHMNLTNQLESNANLLFDHYRLAYNNHLVYQIAGVEIMRRLIGVAQLPLKISIGEKEALMDKAVNWILA